MAYTRVKAYGDKWYRWYSKQRYRKDAKVVPRKHREKKLVSTDLDATYVIRKALKDALRNDRIHDTVLLGLHDQTPVLDGPQHTSDEITKTMGAHSPVAHQAVPLMDTLGAQWGSEQPCSAQRMVEDIMFDASGAVAVGKLAATDTPGQGMVKLEMGRIGASDTYSCPAT